ncbi:DUF1488 family protein [Pseudovibrio sp. Tun.PSC04-5.I4]|uniref:DUF1488 family protein n=1 Tax=Pseudovibrio sp. Tun.PSC04-5.I4 TaxID=1798213 RepID=UPI000885F326|nr:DUF1488 family protein [Pseudovibrio sp. Tun.PSC04-5.I4]SDQ17579.1 Protein of unknown function [Pseudovibrio sp. Tun.PSC04-5.I4]
MKLELIETPEKQINPPAVKFWVDYNGQRISCKISDRALVDDYRQPGEADRLSVFDKYTEDILRRTGIKILDGVQDEDGILTLTIFQGDGMLE